MKPILIKISYSDDQFLDRKKIGGLNSNHCIHQRLKFPKNEMNRIFSKK